VDKNCGGKVQQILYNLLSNAVKFTPEEGRIEINASMPDHLTVRVAITDTGPGIAEKDREKIFEKFRQGDGSITRTQQGTGLGLAISTELAKLLSGKNRSRRRRRTGFLHSGLNCRMSV
jgi:Amt family ammonium transporter